MDRDTQFNAPTDTSGRIDQATVQKNSDTLDVLFEMNRLLNCGLRGCLIGECRGKFSRRFSTVLPDQTTPSLRIQRKTSHLCAADRARGQPRSFSSADQRAAGQRELIDIFYKNRPTSITLQRFWNSTWATVYSKKICLFPYYHYFIRYISPHSTSENRFFLVLESKTYFFNSSLTLLLQLTSLLKWNFSSTAFSY